LLACILVPSLPTTLLAIHPHHASGIGFFDIQGVKKGPGPPPISAPIKHKQMNPILFTNILSTILNDPRKTVHPVEEHALHVVKGQVLLHLDNRLLDFVTRDKLPILENSFQHPKEPKVTRAWVRRIRSLWHSEKIILPEL
jgi:hypothetical protein